MEQKNTLIKDCIFTALMILMEQKDYEDITITDITKKAGVSRMSYYRNYQSKEDILIQYFSDLFEKALNKIKGVENISKKEMLCEFFCVFRENAMLIRNLIQANLHKLLLERFYEYAAYAEEHLLHSDLTDPMVQYSISYATGSIGMVLIRWIETGMQESPEEMAEFLNSKGTVPFGQF